ncbi:MAG: nitroreductase/quinone reductase family protein, partial [Gaiellaceae bacterium]
MDPEGPRPYRKSYWRRGLNAVVRPLARLGLTGPRTHLLTVPGRKSGRLWSTPVSIVQDGDERWLVAPYGERNWVKNARAAGWVRLRRGRR